MLVLRRPVSGFSYFFKKLLYKQTRLKTTARVVRGRELFVKVGESRSVEELKSRGHLAESEIILKGIGRINTTSLAELF